MPNITFERIDDYIQHHLKQDIGLEQLAEQACMSQRSLYVLFERHAGESPHQYIRRCKLERI